MGNLFIKLDWRGRQLAKLYGLVPMIYAVDSFKLD